MSTDNEPSPRVAGSSRPRRVADPTRQDLDRPWRTEGLPGDDDGKTPRRSSWRRLALWSVLAYLAFFALTTMQDRAGDGAAATVAYSEFTRQVERGNVAEVYSRGDSIEGELTSPAPEPGPDAGDYSRFVTERPTFADDDLLSALERGGATVRATPVLQERGLLWNLLISLAPVVLLVGFTWWLFRRQRN